MKRAGPESKSSRSISIHCLARTVHGPGSRLLPTSSLGFSSAFLSPLACRPGRYLQRKAIGECPRPFSADGPGRMPVSWRTAHGVCLLLSLAASGLGNWHFLNSRFDVRIPAALSWKSARELRQGGRDVGTRTLRGKSEGRRRQDDHRREPGRRTGEVGSADSPGRPRSPMQTPPRASVARRPKATLSFPASRCTRPSRPPRKKICIFSPAVGASATSRPWLGATGATRPSSSGD